MSSSQYFLRIAFNIMMTSSNGRIFPLCGEFTGPRWIPHKKACDAELWCFIYLCLNKRLSKQSWGWWFETLSCPLWRYCNDVFGGEFCVQNVLLWCTTLATPSYSAANTKLKVNRNHLSYESWKDWFTTKYENDIRGGYIMRMRYILMSLVCDLQDFALSWWYYDKVYCTENWQLRHCIRFS